MSDSKYTIFIISDGTGETAGTMVKAALVQFQNQDIHIVKCKNVRTESQIESLFDDIVDQKGMVVFTVASRSMRKIITELGYKKNIITVDLLGPLLTGFDTYFGFAPANPQVGALRNVDEKYFKRIEAIEYTVKNDDGKNPRSLAEADIVLVGISRTSKTPLSIFLSHKGWKVANIPLVLNQKLPEELFKIVDQRRVVGLMIDTDALIRIRRNRLEKFGQDPGSEYASRKHIHQEIEYALGIFKKNKRWPVFNVTDRALEETAGEIIRIVATRLDLPYDVML